MKITVPIALCWSFAGIVGAAIAHGLWSIVANAMILALALLLTSKSGVVLRDAIIWTAPFFVMLVLVHGVIGPLFPVRTHILGFLPWRPTGAIYAARVGTTVFSLVLSLFFWRNVSQETLFDDLIWMHVPEIGIVIAGQVISTLKLLQRRVSIVFLAQQARGLQVTGNVAARLKAIPAIVLPVIVGTIVESDMRALMLASRGFGSGPISVIRPRLFGISELLTIFLIPAIILLSSYVLRR